MHGRIFLPLTVLIAATASLTAQSPSFELSRETSIAKSNTLFNGVVTGDFNNDSKPDYIAAGGATAQDLVLYLGNGDGTFQAPKTIGSTEDALVSDMAVADVNNDGKLDLIVVSNNNTSSSTSSSTPGVFQVFLGNGDGTFQAPLTYTTPYTPYSVAVGDFSGNGLEDIAIGDYNGQIEIWNNAGGGAFALAKTITVTSVSNAVEVRAGQFDGDGIIHLAYAVSGQGVGIAWNNGQEDFTTGWVDTINSGTPGIINVGDVAQDGRDDIIFAYQCPYPATHEPPSCESAIDVIYGQGDEKTVVKTVVSDITGLTNIVPWAVDVNGDGIADLVTVVQPSDENDPTGLEVWLANTDGTFSQTPISYYPSTQFTGSIYPADFNRDGMMDFVALLPADEQTEVFLNAGPRATCTSSVIPYSVTACEPVDNTYLTSPVNVWATASTTGSSPVTALQVYIDGDEVYSTSQTGFYESFDLATGPHFIVTKGWAQNGVSFRTDRNITVYSGTPGPVCPTAESAAAICLPSGSTSSSPVQILANGWTPNVPTAAQLYIDGNLVVTEQPCNIEGNSCEGTSYIDTTQKLSSGSHDLVFKLWDNQGNVYTAQKTVTVN